MAIPPEHNNPPLWTWGILLASPLLFSSNLILGRAAIAEIEPGTLAFLRWFFAALALSPAFFALPASESRPLTGLTPLFLLLGFLGMGICGAGVYAALKYTTATNGTLIYTTSPALVVLIEALTGRRRATLLQITGIILATLGVVVIVTRGHPAALASFDFSAGDLIFAVCAVSWAVYSLLLRDPRLLAFPPRALFAINAAFGALVNVPLWLWEGSGHGFLPSTAQAWLSVAGIVLIPSILSFLTYQYCVRVFGAARAAMSMYLLPPFGVGLAAIFLGERLEFYHLPGMVLALAGVIIATLPRRARPEPAAPAA
jgi:drug/metabolite transporter (DMT)-like permease